MSAPDRLRLGEREREAVLQQRAVRELRERVVEGPVAQHLDRGAGVHPGLGVEDVGGGDVGEDLPAQHVLRAQLLGRARVEVQRAQAPAVEPQREGVDGAEALLHRAGREALEPALLGEVGDEHGLTGLVGQDARPFAELELQLLDHEDLLVRRRDEVQLGLASISSTPAPSAGITSITRRASRSRMSWMEKSPTSVRANSARTADSRC